MVCVLDATVIENHECDLFGKYTEYRKLNLITNTIVITLWCYYFHIISFVKNWANSVYEVKCIKQQFLLSYKYT